jgi:hypothetical protein
VVSQTFYDMLRWLNGPDSELETDDCAFGGIRRSSKSELADMKQADGRLMLFYRQLPFNCDQSAEWLMDCFDFHLRRLNTEIDLGVVGLSKAETYFKSILQTGRSLILNFWAWGNTHDEVMDNLNLVFATMFESARCVSHEIAAESKPGNPG